jgi:hypothetical protein
MTDKIAILAALIRAQLLLAFDDAAADAVDALFERWPDLRDQPFIARARALAPRVGLSAVAVDTVSFNHVTYRVVGTRIRVEVRSTAPDRAVASITGLDPDQTQHPLDEMAPEHLARAILLYTPA